MPEKETLKRMQKDKREGKAPTTQAGEFVREEIHHVREGKHGAKSTKQAIAIGLSKARRAGVKLPAPASPAPVRRRAKRDLQKARSGRKTSRRRARATRRALEKAPHRTASRKALSVQARSTARRRGARSRSAAAKKAARTRARSR